ncbi:MAG: Smr/MutS family protein [Hyphomicrobiaceae bacterium]|nr:Smr/MutS family protein [Hyphomicrobiaceae bacterium]
MTRGSRRDDDAPRRRKVRRIAAEEQELWRHVAQSVAPLTNAKPRVPEVELPEPAKPAIGGPAATGPLLPRVPAKVKATAHATSEGAAKAPPAPGSRVTGHATGSQAQSRAGSLLGFARRHARRIASGRIDIEARLDLHGLTQSAAHDRLVGFLTSAAAAGLRTVLVITGKGGRWRVDDGNAPRAWATDAAETGVLRRNVPRWLEEPRLRSLVVSYGSAARHHGGEGAFYVQLRRRGRSERD